MKENIFLLLIASVILFTTCKKDKMEEESGPVKFRFTAGPFFDLRLNKVKSSTVPFAYLFLFNDNGEVIKEQPIHENRVVEITSIRDSICNIGIFNIDWKGDYNFKVFQNISSGFVMKSLGDFSNSLPAINNLNLNNISIKNLNNLDSVKVAKRIRPVKVNDQTNNSYSLDYWATQYPLMIYTNKQILPKYLFADIDNPTNNVSALFDYKKAVNSSEKYIELNRDNRWFIDVYSKLDKNYHIFDNLNDILYHDYKTKTKRIEFTFPDTTFLQNLCKVKNLNDEYYFTAKTLENKKINLLNNSDFKLERQTNSSYICSSTNYAKVINTKVLFRNSSEDLACHVYTNVTAPKSVTSFLPTFPKILTTVYGIKESKIVTNLLFSTQIIASKNDKVNLTSYLNYLYGDQDFEYPHQMELYRTWTQD